MTPALTIANEFVASYEFQNPLVVFNRVAILNLVFWTAENIELQQNVWYTVATIPVGYRPSSDIPCSVSVLGSGHLAGNVHDGRVNTTGEIQIYSKITDIPGRAIINVCYGI